MSRKFSILLLGEVKMVVKRKKLTRRDITEKILKKYNVDEEKIDAYKEAAFKVLEVYELDY